MGTSASSKGPRSTSPLVPAWADADPEAPLPPPEGQRFRAFRTEFGRVAGEALAHLSPRHWESMRVKPLAVRRSVPGVSVQRITLEHHSPERWLISKRAALEARRRAWTCERWWGNRSTMPHKRLLAHWPQRTQTLIKSRSLSRRLLPRYYLTQRFLIRTLSLWTKLSKSSWNFSVELYFRRLLALRAMLGTALQARHAQHF